MRAGIVVTEVFILCCVFFGGGMIAGGVLEKNTGVISHNYNNVANATVDAIIELSESDNNESAISGSSNSMEVDVFTEIESDGI